MVGTALAGCTSLDRLTIHPANPYFRLEGPFLLTKDGTILLQILPALLGSELVLPEGVRELENIEFDLFKSVRSLTLPSSLEELPRDTFQSCEQLVSVHFSPGLRVIGESAFSCCTGLTELALPEGLAEIQASAFEDCDSLVRVSLPESLEAIREAAFMNCSSLREIRIPNGIREIHASSFAECVSLSRITLEPDHPHFRMDGPFLLGMDGLLVTVPANAVEGDVTLPDGVVTLQTGALANCGMITSVIVPASVKRLDSCFFFGMESLREVTFLGIPEKVEWFFCEDPEKQFTVHVPGQIPEGPFREWLEDLERMSFPIRYG